jgi:hypothetical protein
LVEDAIRVCRAQLALEDLSRRVARQLVDDDHGGGLLEPGEVAPAVIDQLGLVRRRAIVCRGAGGRPARSAQAAPAGVLVRVPIPS